MIFPSYTFALFFLTLSLLYGSPIPYRLKKWALLLGSYFFYGAFNPVYIVLLLASTYTDWCVAKRLPDEKRLGRRRALLAVSLIVNLGLLISFKYLAFFGEIGVTIFALLGAHVHVDWPTFVLPLGISFYTFQTLSYTIDVYRGRLKPSRSALDYALYVSFFPQLVAGPIVRAADFLPQCEEQPKVTMDQRSWGLALLGLGLFLKVCIADSVLAPVVDHIYAMTQGLTFSEAWVGTLAFSGQIYCDFGGYTLCAIGVALCFGFHLPDNFRSPYAAIGFSDFWRRWHISLSTWLRDYLYIPLGGNRHGAIRLGVALMVTMLLGGLWHGASWTFVVWGALHGVFLVMERVLKRTVGHHGLWSAPPIRFLLGVLTFVLVCVAWVFFRAVDLPHAIDVIGALIGMGETLPSRIPPWQTNLILLTIGIMLILHGAFRRHSLESVAARLPIWTRAILITFLFLAVHFSPGSHRAFIYFQF